MMRGQRDALLDESPRVRLGAVLDVLAYLAEAEAEPLASPAAHRRGARRTGVPDTRQGGEVQALPGASSTLSAQRAIGAPTGAQGGSVSEAERLNRVLDLLDRRFHEPLRVAELCDVANLSERSLHRYFLRHVGESVGRYLNRLRIGYATRQLTDTAWPIALIATKAGFPNLANFNRQFLSARGMTPSAYRRFFETHGHAPKVAAAAPPNLETRPPSLERLRRRTRQARTPG
jgi:transcriptional regulator GlxA family with amidase domain